MRVFVILDFDRVIIRDKWDYWFWFPIERNEMRWQKGPGMYTGDDKAIGKEPKCMVCTGLETHADA
jgi:hypothetical protein